MADPAIASASRPVRGVPHTALAMAVAFAIPWFHGFAPEFLYDAAQYWGGAAALVAGESPVVPGALSTRGVFTAVAYIVPAAVTAILGPTSAFWTVLAWNAALGAIVATILIPRLGNILSSAAAPIIPPSRIWVSAVLGAVMLSGFARFPLVDVWSTALALAAFYGLAVASRWWVLSLAGVAAVAAISMRPSLIAPLAIAVLVLLSSRPKAIGVAIPAAVLAFVPQLVLNVRVWGLWSPAPLETTALSAVQARWAAFALRYDTVAYADQRPQQWFCDARYAGELVVDPVPQNQVEVVASAANHLPDSLWFLFRKASAGLQWTSATPYENPPGTGIDTITVIVLGTSVVGVAALVARAVAVRRGTPLVRVFALIGFWFGALATLVFSTPETRFAAPLVLVGLVGVIAVTPSRLRRRRPTKATLIAGSVSIVLFVVLLLAGLEVQGHALPPGPLVDAAGCAFR